GLDVADGTIRSYGIGEGLTGWIAEFREVLRLRDTKDQDELAKRHPDLKWLGKWREQIHYEDVKGRWAFLGAPLESRGQLIGVIRLSIKANGAEFQFSDEMLIKRVADTLARWIDNLWLAEADRRRLEQLQLSVKLGDRLTGALDFNKVCEII